MKKSLTIKLLALLMAAVAGAAQGSIIFRATLTHDQEVTDPNPPIPDEGSGGVATFVLNDAMTRLTYDVRLFGLDMSFVQPDGATPLPPPVGPNFVTRLHIHRAPANNNGGIVFGMIDGNASTRNDLDALVIDVAGLHVTGDWDLAEGNAGATLATELANLLGAGLYINVHTSDHASGEIRGQILQVPEPATWALFGIGSLGLIGCALLRRRPD